jgi:hypothetical protein
MPIGEIIGIALLTLTIAPAFILMGLGLRYLFYSEDSWNLDKIYVKFFEGRRRKRYRQFTQRIGLVLLLLGMSYTWYFVWPIMKSTFK